MAHHVRGHETSQLLSTWLRVWLPRQCSYRRRSSLEAATCPRLRALLAKGRDRAHSWHVLLLGDSAGNRGIYCHLYALLLKGTEQLPLDSDFGDAKHVGCGGMHATGAEMPYASPKVKRFTVNSTHELISSASKESSGRAFGFSVPLAHGGAVRISWVYVGGLWNAVAKTGQLGAESILAAVAAATSAGGPPDEIVYAGSVWDYMVVHDGTGRNLVMESTPAQRAAWENTFRSVSESRAAGYQRVASAFASHPATRLWYRGTHCNSRYPAALADVLVAREAAGRVLDMVNLSRALWMPKPYSTWEGEQAWEGTFMEADLFHFDRTTSSRPASYAGRPHVGELQAQSAQSLLHRLCETQ